MSAIITSLPFAQFRRIRTFYLWYDGLYAAFALSAIGLMVSSGFEGLLPDWNPLYLALLPVAAYVSIMAHVFIHNASHGNFPKAINRIVGEICGAIVLTKFASWEITHRRHHRYSDDSEKDPHPAERGYWRYAFNTLIKVELQLRQSYFDVYGDTPATRRYESVRSLVSFASGLMLMAFWFFLMGPGGFFMLFLPAFVGAALFVIHFNWAGHNAHNPDETIAPADLDHGWFWLGNRLFFGIYYHGTHHRMSMLFNPMKAPKKRAERSDDEGVRATA
ncbi:MAG: fatty acid desaturase [Sandaracinaceae bacterium]